MQFDWQSFKEGRFIVRLESQKELFFLEAKANGIFCFIGEHEKERNLFICVHRYDDSFSAGRFEIYSVDEKIVPHHESFKSLPIITIQTQPGAKPGRRRKGNEERQRYPI